jgi:hypothetical protein
MAGSATVLSGVLLPPTAPVSADAATPAVSEWNRAAEVPGLGVLNAGGRAEVESVSCDPTGECAAGGSYENSDHALQGFVASQQNGEWTPAIEVPGLGALNAGGRAEVLSVSCGAAGDCAAGGYYYSKAGQQGFVVSEIDGTWGDAIELPGLAQLNRDGSAEVGSVSCDPTGDCAAGGYYKDARGRVQGFVASELSGTWESAIVVPGLAALNAGGRAEVTSVSCPAPNTCTAGGYYKGRRARQGFVSGQVNGTWSRAAWPPKLATLNLAYAGVSSVSCAVPGDCAATGYYQDHHDHQQIFVASELNGTWGNTTAMPGIVKLNTGRSAKVSAVSCSSAGNCAAGGSYLNRQDTDLGFVSTELNGTWGNAAELPGLASLNSGTAQVSSVSCSPAGNCAAGGYYQDRLRNTQGFVDSHA